ncbi:carboxypeptidase-like regulatory domain-containing protein [Mucilaginibacter myungsuensis]|uniref:Carboxypeptidase regulatory-like domain-containing protein n=1 Tax=Mucilaginibacter myungsuensis TaxID=649104 RepID=A0A929PZP6_9SPHI|nr:carboxypeptidase-like regulatory domain-containing protein [Mucilaginibacter myungsuensis]MBE9664642.1 carboxypeptidase regulatory-like domain-containing protein [Mucilaginibacter myungsuensis]MDN3601467.1 carboxypeptidase-like regulatory domain-containing protein [Mucilaginibacter myungsuensis]
MKKRRSLTTKIASLVAVVALLAFAPIKEDPIDKIVNALQKWMDARPQEKVYLHMDKPYYALGDTIWFKGYVMIGAHHQLSAYSGAVHVDLINDRDSIINSLKLPVTTGMVMGNFILEDDLTEGNYRIRAYTQWMRNVGDDYFFDRTFTVGATYTGNIIGTSNFKYQGSGNKQSLLATLNYTDDQGKPLANKDVKYQIVINKGVVNTKTAKTDADGNIQIAIDNDGKANQTGSYIRTYLEGAEKKVVVRNFPIKANQAQTDIQFFPESGSLVNGIQSRVGIKAVGIDGLGLKVTGKVYDQNNAEVAATTTQHAGMGSFSLKPEDGKTYTAKMTLPDGSEQSVALPKANNDGLVLSVFQSGKDSLLLRVSASAGQLQRTPSIGFIAQSGGETVFAGPVKLEPGHTAIWLDRKAFPSGIAQFTLFSDAGEPLAERIAFIRAADQMQLALKTARTSYKGKERVDIAMDAKDSKAKPVIGNFSIAVIDESKVPIDETAESTIYSNVLLTSDLKGYIERPNYYFVNVNDEVNTALDNLMLTQGYRRFLWKEVTAATPPELLFEPEAIGTKISGTVYDLRKRILPHAKMSLLSIGANVANTTTADEKGRFKFDGIFMTDSLKFAVQARTDKNTDKTILVLDTVPKMKLAKNKNFADLNTNIAGTMKVYIANGKRQDEIYEKAGQFDKVQRLREVRIQTKRTNAAKDPKIATQGMYRIPAGSADQTMTLENPESCPTLAMCLMRRMPPGTRMDKVNGMSSIVDLRGNLITLFMNGRKIDNPEEAAEILDGAVEPTDVARLDIVRTNQAMLNMLSLGRDGAAILIYTKTPYSRTVYDPSVVNIKPKGFNKVRDFYSPKYGPGANLKFPDLRTTVYWNPYVKTTADGKAIFSFFNADGPGKYRVIVEGINADGELGRQVYTYTVEASNMTGSVSPKQPIIGTNKTMVAAIFNPAQNNRQLGRSYMIK